MNSRLEKLRLALPEDVDALLILKPDNRTYISGFTGSNAFVVVGREAAILLTDFRYVEQATLECPDFTVSDYAPVMTDSLNAALAAANIKSLAFESDFVTVSQHEMLQEKLTARLLPTTGLVENLRQVKDAAEIEAMRQAALIAEAALAEVLPLIKVGVSEKYIALNLEFALRRLGACLLYTSPSPRD